VRWALFLVLLLAGCGAQSDFRDRSAPISSTTRYDDARMAGKWLVRARFAEPDEPLLPGEIHFSADLEGGPISQMQTYGVCPGGRIDVVQVAPGRFRAPNGREFWLLWVDSDWRTAAMGSPDGRFGWILSRDLQGGEDRMAAARDVFEWVGYDMGRLIDLQ